MRGRGEQVLDVVLVAEVAAAHALAAAALHAELVDRHRLHVALVRQHDHELFVFDEVEVGEVAEVGGDLGAAVVAVLVADRGELVLDHAAQLRVVGEDRLELGDRRPQLVELVAELLALERGQPAQLHVEDVRGLRLAELERRDHAAPAWPRRPTPSRGSA